MGCSMLEFIGKRNLIPPGSLVLCAVSGGADSVFLLRRLYELRDVLGFQLAAAHYNHHLRGEESDRDEAFVGEFVAKYCPPESGLPAVKLYVGGGDVLGESRRRKKGVEETAREMRYAFLRQTARDIGATRIATAHTADDNGETLLLHLVRGSALRGLTGISPQRGNLIRPMLTTTRQEVEDYLRLYSLPHVEDSTNRVDAYSRNFLRHRVVPELKALNPAFLARVTETIRFLEADEAYLEEQAQTLAGQAVSRRGEVVISAALLAQAPTPLASRAVRSLLGQCRRGDEDCAAVHLEAVLNLCKSGDPSGCVRLPHALAAWREYDLLVLGRAEQPEALAGLVPLTAPGQTRAGEYVLRCAEVIYQGQRQGPYRVYLAREKCPELLLRARRTGDVLRRPGRPGRTVKKLCIDEKIPARYRSSLPVLTAGGQVAAVAGLGPDEAFLPHVGEPAWEIAMDRKEDYDAGK